MSFIIKGFDTDGNCLHCFFQGEDTDRCLLTDDDIPLYGKGHPESCPLVPLPEGHGRIVDAAEVLEKAGNSPWFDGDVSELGLLLGSEVTTIIPAEGGTDDDG